LTAVSFLGFGAGFTDSVLAECGSGLGLACFLGWDRKKKDFFSFYALFDL
jgi:hypothetical protein